MSSTSSSSRNYNPTKPVIVRRVPTLSSYSKSNNMPGSGHEDGADHQLNSGSVVQGNDKDSGRERLKRHREEVAGRVSIPDKWGKEELLRDWMDYSSFDSLLAPNGLASARKALIAEGRRSGSQRFMRIGTPSPAPPCVMEITQKIPTGGRKPFRICSFHPYDRWSHHQGGTVTSCKFQSLMKKARLAPEEVEHYTSSNFS